LGVSAAGPMLLACPRLLMGLRGSGRCKKTDRSWDGER